MYKYFSISFKVPSTHLLYTISYYLHTIEKNNIWFHYFFFVSVVFFGLDATPFMKMINGLLISFEEIVKWRLKRFGRKKLLHGNEVFCAMVMSFW
jgi:hypothetical protein